MKRIIDFSLVSIEALTPTTSLLRLIPADCQPLPECLPGQFVEVKAPASSGILLRRPISINYVDYHTQTLSLLVRNAGRGSAAICDMQPGMHLNVVMPLGNGFSMPADGSQVLLVGGGVGVAPLLHLGSELKEKGICPHFLLGARTAAELLEVDMFESQGTTYLCTDDGSRGVHGVVTDHPVWDDAFDMVYCCGPVPMMKAVARKCREKGVECEVSLENMMACGLGACLCCVEPTVKGNVCVCTEGPVFNISQLLW